MRHTCCSPLDAQGVDLVHEDDARGVDTCTLEQISHTCGTHSHDSLHKLGATHLQSPQHNLRGLEDESRNKILG